MVGQCLLSEVQVTQQQVALSLTLHWASDLTRQWVFNSNHFNCILCKTTHPKSVTFHIPIFGSIALL